MPLNITGTDTPQDVGAIELPPVTAAGVGRPLNITETDTPQDVGANELPPVTAAGVGLARLVLGIAVAAIVLLVLYLLVMDVVVGHNVHKAYNQIRESTRSGSEFYTMDRLERLSVDLKDARDNQSKATLSAESVQNAQNIMEMLGRLPSVTSTQKSQLKDCIPPPSDVTRNEKLDRCLQMIEGTRQAALEAAAGAISAQVAGESANRINEHRQSLHTFWIQAAQLILLNLLLPLLTALFGYIFGTQQAQR